MWKVGSRVFCQARSLQARKQTLRSCSGHQGVLAIRREDASVWERRAPLAPSHVKNLSKKGIKVLVQPSNRRAYPMQEYMNAGAHIQEDLSEASVIIGVKQVPIDMLEADKTYVFFSHTIKAQPDNMAMLDAILEKRIRLIDYERMVDDKGVRVVAFGKYAGVAGMINILHGMGLRLLALGHHTPFMHIGPAHNYRHTMHAMQAIRDAGYEISLGSMPKSLGPLTFVFTGSGNVSQGAQEVFQGLPVEYIEPEHLPKVAKHGATNRVYGCVIGRKDHLVRKDGGGFNAQEFEEFPDRYASVFSIKHAPYASCIINGIYWAPNSPRLISIPDAKSLLQPQRAPWLPITPGCPQLPHRLLAICDISADPGGSIEFMKECTTIDKPFCVYDAEENMNYESFAGDGVLICSIDNMPAQIPREATDFFGGLLLPYVEDIMKSNAATQFSEFNANRVVKDATITSNGQITDNFKYIQDLRLSSSSRHKSGTCSNTSKRVLVLGSGFVSAPVIDYLTRDDKTAVTVASQLRSEVDQLSAVYPNTTPVLLDMYRSQDEVEKLVEDHDIVISLLPYALHPDVMKMCIKHKTNMVTASYQSPGMTALHKAAEEAGILVMNEVGVDPGIDHMLAMQCFDEVRDHGARVKSFTSWCGGLPAPENSDNPLRYKFNWSPLGVLKNVLAGARFLRDGKVVDIPEGQLLNNIQEMNFLPGFNLEGFPNRDSCHYIDTYGIPGTTDVIRGTLRFKGFGKAVQALWNIGLIDMNPHPLLHPKGPDITWRSFMCELVGQKQDILVDSLQSIVHDALGHDDQLLSCIVDLGLLEDELVDQRNTPIDTLSNYLSKRLAYGPRERDLIVMHHEVGIQWPDNQRETRHIDLVYYGNPDKYSAMSATVGFTTGIATKMVLEGEIQGKGMMLPFDKQVYRPILKRLEYEGIQATERTIHH